MIARFSRYVLFDLFFRTESSQSLNSKRTYGNSVRFGLYQFQRETISDVIVLSIFCIFRFQATRVERKRRSGDDVHTSSHRDQYSSRAVGSVTDADVGFFSTEFGKIIIQICLIFIFFIRKFTAQTHFRDQRLETVINVIFQRLTKRRLMSTRLTKFWNSRSQDASNSNLFEMCVGLPAGRISEPFT